MNDNLEDVFRVKVVLSDLYTQEELFWKQRSKDCGYGKEIKKQVFS